MQDLTNVFGGNAGMTSNDPCHQDYKPSLNMGYPTCTEAAALRNLARAERTSRRTQERERLDVPCIRKYV